MASTEHNLENEEEFLKLQKQINEAAKESLSTFKGMGEYTNVILKNYKDIQKTNAKIRQTEKEISSLLAEGSEESKQRAAILQQEVQQLRKQNEQYKAINKQMVLNRNVITGMFKSTLGVLKDIGIQYLDFDQKSRDVAANIGLSNDRMYMMRQNVMSAGVAMAQYGVSINDAYEAQQAYSDELGRSVVLSEQALTSMAQIGKATGLGIQGVAGMASQMELFGYGAEDASKFIYDMYQETVSMGLNASKVSKKFEQNLSLLNKLNFKAGVKGLKDMAQFSEKFKIDMQAVASVADKVFRPEGAIEAAAQLQVLGGSLAALGDPFQLMYKARNSPEELAKSLTKAATASAVFNSRTKEFEVNAYELDRLKEAASALNIDYQQLVETAKQGAKFKTFGRFLGGKGLTKEESEAIATMSQMKDGKAQIEFIGKDGKKFLGDLSNLTGTELRQALQKKKEAEEAAQQATGVRQQWEALFNQFTISLFPIFETLTKNLKPLLDKIAHFATNFFKGVSDFLSSPLVKGLLSFVAEHAKFLGSVFLLGKILSPFFEIGWWYLKGRMLGMGFNSQTSKGNLVSALTGGGTTTGGATTTGGGITSAATTTTTGTTPGGGQSGVIGQISQLSPTQILSIAAALVAVGAAILLIGQGVKLASEGLSTLVKSFKDLSGGEITGALLGMTIVMGGFVAMVYILASASTIAAGPLLALGGAMLAIGGGVALAAYGVSLLVDSFTRMFTVIGPNGDSLLKAGAGFILMSAGIYSLAGALISLSAASLLALPGLYILDSVTSKLTETSTALNTVGGGEGLTKAINAINSVDESKLEALRDLSIMMSLLGATTTIKFDESLKVGGSIEITGAAGGKTNTDWINDPIFVSRLKEKIETSKSVDRKGGLSV